jgi:hypothetical protein
LPAIVGYVPDQMVVAIQSFLEFSYLVRRSVIDQDTLVAIENAVTQFHAAREIFIITGVCKTMSLPRQHSMVHYVSLIRLFGAPNGLCSSITESKHIKAIKEPWRRSSRNNAMGQMLTINQRLNKLAAARVDFQARRMIPRLSPGSLTVPIGLLTPSAAQDEHETGATEGIRTDADVKLAHSIGS